MVKLKAKKMKNGILISEDSFEHLLNCLDNQKFINDINADATEEGIDEVKKIQRENQKCIDDFNKQCREILQNKNLNNDKKENFARK